MPTTTNLLNEAKLLQEELVSTRRHLHAHPELSFAEHETAKLAAQQLMQLGYKTKTGLARTGVIADVGSGVTVAIRADMDALPIQEEPGAPYQSKVPGVMHACGHDAHVSIALATAKLLAAEKFPGRIRMLMQPAEESGDDEGCSGAKRMIEAGAMEGVNVVIGLHVDSTLAAGKVGIIPGAIMAAADSFKITVKGKGGHGAYPESTIDSIVLACQIVQAAQHIVSRRVSALEPAVVTIGSIHSSSTRENVISEEVTLLGTIRSFSQAVREKLIAELDRVCSITRALGGDYKIDWEMGYPATVNDPFVTDIMHGAACDLLGADNVLAVHPKTWSEDFSMLAQVVPGAFMFLGAEIQGSRRSHHSPTFDIDESGLYIGAAILAETARRLLSSLESRQ